MVTGDILLKVVLDFTVQPIVIKWTYDNKYCLTLKKQKYRWRQTIFDVVPGRHQFGFQFIHLIGLSSQLPAWINGLRQPGTKAALVLQKLLPLVLYRFILHYPCYVLCCTRRNWVHTSQRSKRDSAAHCCNRALKEDTKRRQTICQITGLKVLLIGATTPPQGSS